MIKAKSSWRYLSPWLVSKSCPKENLYNKESSIWKKLKETPLNLIWKQNIITCCFCIACWVTKSTKIFMILPRPHFDNVFLFPIKSIFSQIFLEKLCRQLSENYLIYVWELFIWWFNRVFYRFSYLLGMIYYSLLIVRNLT